MDSLGLQAMSLSDGTTAYIQQDASGEKLIEGKVIELEDGSTAFVQQITVQKESITFEDGQPIALEDGTMAFIHHIPKEGYDPNTLEAVQLEDGSTAFIHPPVSMPMGSAILAVQADVGLEELAVGKKDNTFDLDTITAPKDYASKDVQEEEVRSSGKGPKVADRAYHCEHNGCGRFFTTSHHLKVHERVHTGDRPYRCDFPSCGKTFSTGYSLKSHGRTHTGEKPYQCPEDLCTKAFKTSGDLQKHIRTHTGERPFRCPFEGCGRAFTTSNIRKVHIRTHTGERPYMCAEPNCGRGFTSATNYKNHMRIHTGERPYACLVPGCGKHFTEYSSLYKHHVVHTHCKPYTCNTCGKTYRQTSTLAMHKRTIHGELETTEENEQAVCEQHLEVASAEKNLPPLKHQCIISAKEDGEEEDCMPLVSQEEAEQVSLSHEDLQNLTSHIAILTHTDTTILPPQEKTSVTGADAGTVAAIVTSGTTVLEDSPLSSVHEQQLAVLATANDTHIVLQLKEQHSLEETISIATASVKQESATVKAAKSNNGC